MRIALVGAGLALAAALSPPSIHAQSRATTTGDGLQVWLMTIGQGEEIWEKFGHNALWFVDSAAGIDVAYNWGIFDFAQPGFLRRFLTGDTRYWVEGYPGDALIDYYRRSDRDVQLQRLSLTPEQAKRAYEYSRWNAREENKYYRYDYFRDNCSTRVRDVIDLALGGALRNATSSTRVPLSYRSESLRLVSDMPLTQFGMHIALGRPADRPLSVWESMFIPMRLRDALRNFPSTGGPLVAEERTVYRGSTQRERPAMPPLTWPYLAIGVLLAAQLVILAHAGLRSLFAERLFRVEAIGWTFVLGVAGLVLLLAWTATRHVFWYRNENLLLLNPLSLWIAALLVASWRRERWLRPAAIAAVLIAMLGSLALLLKGVPGFTQNNIALLALFLPPHFAIAYALRLRGRFFPPAPRGTVPSIARASAQPSTVTP